MSRCGSRRSLQAVLLRTRLNDVPDLAESGRWPPPTIVQYAAECRAEPLPA